MTCKKKKKKIQKKYTGQKLGTTNFVRIFPSGIYIAQSEDIYYAGFYTFLWKNFNWQNRCQALTVFLLLNHDSTPS